MKRIQLSVLYLLPMLGMAQYTLSGLRGMINVPHAEVLKEKTFMIGVHTNDQEYFLLDYGENRQDGDEYVSVVSFGFYDRLNITLMLSRIFGDPEQTVGVRSSIGDRSIQFTYVLLKEGAWRPALAINLTDPLFSTSQFLAGNHLVASKHLIKNKTHDVNASLGYGVPYLLTLSEGSGGSLQDKESGFLTGFFGGIAYQYVPAHLNVMLEYDGRSMNAGVGVKFWEKLSLQGYLQGFKYPGIGINFSGSIH